MSAPFDKQKRPKVGIGVLVTSTDHTGCVLVGKRKGNVAGEGMFALPVGHLEFGKTWEECTIRETKEETGLQLKNVQFYHVCNGLDLDHDYHYLELYMIGEVDETFQREPVNMEPDKCEGWYWMEWRELKAKPEQLFFPLRLLLDQGMNPLIKMGLN
ncbi:nucleotide triphosphate diphosphatase NUDT15-like isoform X1 [Mya arenaria]|uniref:nucleotide triphosphate diphosphatase NUDT15-like isoform X1 n=1 Tax=Mya arenaria TaxID=6604 RepID=UPI0022E6FFAD|nr:nucleotide triphosphate diphosphatase NUDT15-like isoform X1 [Mya arenaria]